jgi:hypothetical protein
MAIPNQFGAHCPPVLAIRFERERPPQASQITIRLTALKSLVITPNHPHITLSFAAAPPARSEFQTPVGAKREETYV